MRYPDSVVEDVRERNDIVDVIGGYVKLTKKGNSYWGLCPFHAEKTASFHVTTDTQMYYCFGCHASGNVYTFLMNYESLSFTEALQRLAERAGVELPQARDDSREQSHRASLLAACKEAAKYYYVLLRDRKGQQGYAYLTGRGLSDETMRGFGLGFAAPSGGLAEYLIHKGFDFEIIKEAGLAVYDEGRGRVRDRFWNRVMFPIQDRQGRVIGFGGRVMGDGEPKYLNSPETPIFDKSSNLYGLYAACRGRAQEFILCEGYMDVIAMHQAGFTQAVASLGTSFTAGQCAILKRFDRKILLAYDSDTAGIKATLRSLGILRDSGLTGRVINLLPCKDPDEFIKNNGADAFKKRIEEAENGFMYEIRQLEADYDTTDPDDKTRFLKAVAAKLVGFSEEAERDSYLEAVARTYGISGSSMSGLVVAAAAAGRNVTGRAERSNRPTPSSAKPLGGPKQVLVAMLARFPKLLGQIAEYIKPEALTDDERPMIGELAAKLFAQYETGKPIIAASLIDGYEDESKQQEAAEILNSMPGNLDTDAEIEKAFRDVAVAVLRANLNAAGTVSAQEVIEGKRRIEKLGHVDFHIGEDAV